jgi:hypothetical protein
MNFPWEILRQVLAPHGPSPLAFASLRSDAGAERQGHRGVDGGADATRGRRGDVCLGDLGGTPEVQKSELI